jgi:prepilin-type processing-associated H-X9-DG protein
MSVSFDYDPEFNSATSKKSSRRRFTLVELLAALGIIVVLIALMLPAIRTAGPAAMRGQCINNMKQIALALYNYEHEHKVLPPAVTVDANGAPLHSWRTLILPYLELGQLYQSINLVRPWNDPVNAKALESHVSLFHCPGSVGRQNTTTYLAIVAPGGCFLPRKPRRLADITDDHGSTISMIEAGEENAVPWMAPADADEALVLSLRPESNLHHVGGTNASFVDGSVRFLKASIPASVRRALLSISGDEKVSADQY